MENLYPTEIPFDLKWKKDVNALIQKGLVSHFQEPDDELNYASYSFICSHNSYTEPRYFKIVRQQDGPILHQLVYGVRGINFDTYNWTDASGELPCAFATLVGPEGCNVCISHGEPGIVSKLQKGTLKFQSLKLELRRIIEYMKINTKSVITISFEDYADKLVTIKEIKEVMSEANYDPLFKAIDLSENKGWPTLGWMRKFNKRLIIFSQNTAGSDITFARWAHYIENSYGSIDEQDLYKLRSECQLGLGGELVAFNYYEGKTLTPLICLTEDQVKYENVKQAVERGIELGFAKGKIFNVCSSDRIMDSCDELYSRGERTVFEYLNEINSQKI